jgi:hypothetical protein
VNPCSDSPIYVNTAPARLLNTIATTNVGVSHEKNRMAQEATADPFDLSKRAAPTALEFPGVPNNHR